MLPLALCIGSAGFLASDRVNAGEADEWEYDARVYMWVAAISGESSSGGDIDIDFDELWDNLDMAFMGGLTARKGKWSLMLDPVYLKESGSEGWVETIPVGPLNVPTNFEGRVKLESWITNVGVGYELMRTDKARLDVLAGARYLSMDVDVELDLMNVITTASDRVSVSEHNWDAIVGLEGSIDLADRWSLLYRGDVGAGDSDFTANAVAAVAYEFSWGQVIAGYRYLHYEFDDDNVGVLVNDMDIKGPLLGAQFNF
ncbi:MAG: hypothetical protein WBO06_02185 [Gammaproteobacteria bacterium]